MLPTSDFLGAKTVINDKYDGTQTTKHIKTDPKNGCMVRITVSASMTGQSHLYVFCVGLLWYIIILSNTPLIRHINKLDNRHGHHF